MVEIALLRVGETPDSSSAADTNVVIASKANRKNRAVANRIDKFLDMPGLVLVS